MTTTAPVSRIHDATCPPWCVNGSGCGGDHWADRGCDAWLAVTASGWPKNPTTVRVAPTWGASDGLEPAVMLWLSRANDVDESIDLTVTEARDLIDRLSAAADAAEKATR